MSGLILGKILAVIVIFAFWFWWHSRRARKAKHEANMRSAQRDS